MNGSVNLPDRHQPPRNEGLFFAPFTAPAVNLIVTTAPAPSQRQHNHRPERTRRNEQDYRIREQR
jgi:hypothetical protein